jgi:hypothetical protein
MQPVRCLLPDGLDYGNKGQGIENTNKLEVEIVCNYSSQFLSWQDTQDKQKDSSSEKTHLLWQIMYLLGD